MQMKGNIHSIETLGGRDGPGLRCVVFFQGCPLRCLYCHNPDTWTCGGREQVTAEQLVGQIKRYRSYFGARGGVTLSGGEPLMQPEFAAEVLRLCRQTGIHTALDTSGYRVDALARSVLDHTDLVLLDMKHTDPDFHKRLTGRELAPVLTFLDETTARGLDVWIRQVIVPGLNDSPVDIERLADLLRSRPNVRKVELLGYHSMGRRKWEAMGMRYPLSDVPDMDHDRLAELQGRLESLLAARPASQLD